ncbi:MAG TPA: ABC transporter permease [Thermoanaerobaculia bacterium]
MSRTHWTKFRRDRAAFVMTFIVPIAFFSLFAVFFGTRPGSKRIQLAVVNEDGGAASRQFLTALRKEKGITFLDQEMTAADAERKIRTGDLALALVVPKGFEVKKGERPRLTLLADTSDPFSSRLVGTLMQKAVLGEMPIDVQTRDLLGASKRNPRIAFTAAGLGVMFLLFFAASSGGALIDESESGTLDRILCSQVTMTQLLAGKLFYIVALSTFQLTMTFAWGSLVFGLELREHLGGFLVMTLATSLATGAFGLVLASLCRTRAQLSALSNLLVLVMSALGGSLFPRFLMPEQIQKLGLLTLNGWALDGYLKVFWREEPLLALWPQVTALLLIATVFFTLARVLARRWEAA